MEDLIRKAVASVAGVDFVEARIHRAAGSRVTYVGKELEDIGRSTSLGGCVRALVNGAWGFCSFNDVQDLEKYVAMAARQARLIGGGTARLADVAAVTGQFATVPEQDPAEVSLAEKEALCRAYNDLLRKASDKVQTTSVRYVDSSGALYYGNSQGALLRQDTTFCGVSVAAIARDGVNVQTGRHSVGDLRGFQICKGLEAKCDEAAKQAVDLLSAEPIKAGKYTVLCNPQLCGVFVHEAFGHLSEADFIYENERLQEIMTWAASSAASG